MGHHFTPEKFTFELVITPFITRAISSIARLDSFFQSVSLSIRCSQLDIELCHKNIGCYQSSNLTFDIKAVPHPIPPLRTKTKTNGTKLTGVHDCSTRPRKNVTKTH